MTFRLFNGAYIADSARVAGQVQLDQQVNVWYGAVIRGDVAKVRIGAATNVQDNAVLHCDFDRDLIIGKNVTIGHSAVVHCEAVDDGSLIGMHATVLGGALIGKDCIIAAGAVVAPGMQVPDGMVVMGVPGKVVRPTTDKERKQVAYGVGRYVELAKLYHERPQEVRCQMLKAEG